MLRLVYLILLQTPGHIYLIRFIRSNRILNIFGEKHFMLGEVESELSGQLLILLKGNHWYTMTINWRSNILLSFTKKLY